MEPIPEPTLEVVDNDDNVLSFIVYPPAGYVYDEITDEDGLQTIYFSKSTEEN